MSDYDEIKSKFEGKWKVYKSENFEDFLQEVGVNALLRKVASKASPEMEIAVSNDKIKVTMKTGFFTSVDDFSLDEEYMKEMQGVWMKATGSYHEAKLVMKQAPIDPKATVKPQTIHRERVGDELVITIFVNNVVCKRYFKRIS